MTLDSLLKKRIMNKKHSRQSLGQWKITLFLLASVSVFHLADVCAAEHRPNGLCRRFGLLTARSQGAACPHGLPMNKDSSANMAWTFSFCSSTAGVGRSRHWYRAT